MKDKNDNKKIVDSVMTMTPRVRKFALTAHVTASVGWLGAVLGFLAHAVAGLVSKDAQIVRAAYLMMELTGWFVLVPLSFASLITGLIQSLGTAWGLFRHYWVTVKLLITVFATIVLLTFMQGFSNLASVAVEPTLSTAELGGHHHGAASPVVHASVAIVLLLVCVVLSVYKPWGKTRYGQRRQNEPRIS
ncbi:MAG: DUF2269 domain-containing protein [Pyrinomonadaceae bacterium]